MSIVNGEVSASDFDMMAAYGDVPWIDKVLSDTDTEDLYCERTSRDEVAKHILKICNGRKNTSKKVVQEQTINVHVVRA